MTHEPTHDPTYRDRLMAALSAAERLVAEAPVVPLRAETYERHPSWPLHEIGVRLYYRADPDAVRALADAIGGTVTTQRHTSTLTGRPYIETVAEGLHGGVRVHAHTHVGDPRPAAPAAAAIPAPPSPAGPAGPETGGAR